MEVLEKPSTSNALPAALFNEINGNTTDVYDELNRKRTDVAVPNSLALAVLPNVQNKPPPAPPKHQNHLTATSPLSSFGTAKLPLMSPDTIRRLPNRHTSVSTPMINFTPHEMQHSIDMDYDRPKYRRIVTSNLEITPRDPMVGTQRLTGEENYSVPTRKSSRMSTSYYYRPSGGIALFDWDGAAQIFNPLDPAQNRPIPPAPWLGKRRTFMDVAGNGEQVYITGIVDGQQDTHIYNWKSETWLSGLTMTHPDREWYTSQVLNDRLCIFGGRRAEDETPFKCMAYLDLPDRGWQQGALMPHWHTSCLVSARLSKQMAFVSYVNTSQSKYILFDASRERSTEVKPPKGQALFCDAAAVLGGCVYLTELTQTAQNGGTSIMRYDPGADQWTQAAHLQHRRQCTNLVEYNGVLFAAGGEDGDDNQHWHLDTVEMYDPRAGGWQTLPERIDFCGSHSPVCASSVGSDTDTFSWCRPSTIMMSSGFLLSTKRERVIPLDELNPEQAVWTVSECLAELQIAQTQGDRKHTSTTLKFVVDDADVKQPLIEQLGALAIAKGHNAETAHGQLMIQARKTGESPISRDRRTKCRVGGAVFFCLLLIMLVTAFAVISVLLFMQGGDRY